MGSQVFGQHPPILPGQTSEPMGWNPARLSITKASIDAENNLFSFVITYFCLFVCFVSNWQARIGLALQGQVFSEMV